MTPRPATPRIWRWLGTGAVALLLAGCALPRMIDSEVESFVGTPGAVLGASYRFERLPSQQAQGLAQDRIEALAEPALERAGLVRTAVQPRYSVQIGVNVLEYIRPSVRQPRWGGYIMGSTGAPWYPGIGGGIMLSMEPPWYSHTVHVLMRDIASAQVVFESTARFEGPWSDSANLLPAILDAALRDYPTPPPGVRKVVVELPREGQPAP